MNLKNASSSENLLYLLDGGGSFGRPHYNRNSSIKNLETAALGLWETLVDNVRKESDNIKELITALDRKLERLRGMIQAGSVFKAIPNRLNLILSDLEAQLFEFIARTGIGRDINVGEVNRALNEVGCLELEVNGWLGII